MVFADWAFSGAGSGSLDTVVKYSGTSSYMSAVDTSTNYLTHDTFLEPRMQVVCWGRQSSADNYHKMYIRHSSYGDLQIVDAPNEWQKWRVTFWYDIGANTKWGRIEKYVASAWVQQGTDTNFGSGSPAAASIVLKHRCWVSTKYAYFDDVEVYS